MNIGDLLWLSPTVDRFYIQRLQSINHKQQLLRKCFQFAFNPTASRLKLTWQCQKYLFLPSRDEWKSLFEPLALLRVFWAFERELRAGGIFRCSRFIRKFLLAAFRNEITNEWSLVRYFFLFLSEHLLAHCLMIVNTKLSSKLLTCFMLASCIKTTVKQNKRLLNHMKVDNFSVNLITINLYAFICFFDETTFFYDYFRCNYYLENDFKIIIYK